MKEKIIQSIFTAYIQDHSPTETTVWELKVENGTSFLFSKVKDHQITALGAVKRGGLFHKISDSPMSWMKGTPMRFGRPKPFDCFFIRGARAYVALLFYKPKKRKDLLMIDVDDFVRERNASVRKSLTELRAREIASEIIKISAL